MRTANDDYYYLTVTEGVRRGSLFPLRSDLPNRVGRGTECKVRLNDPGCSREHAAVLREADGWWMVQTTVRPVEAMRRRTRMTTAAARLSRLQK